MNRTKHPWTKGFLSGAAVAAILLLIRLVVAFTGPSTAPGVGSGAIAADSSNNIAVGTSTIPYRFTVAGAVDSLFGLIRSGASYPTIFRLGTDSTLIVNSGNVDTLTLKAGNVGIGTSTPQTKLSVGDTTTALVAIFGGGSGKIDAGTIDPVYTIGRRRYATYLPSMTGVKEETSGVVHPECGSGGTCAYTIDFRALPEGSDVWLFSKVTDLEDHFDDLAVLLTPSVPVAAWYEKDFAHLRLTMYAKANGARSPEISYRLTAPRFDASGWPTRLEDGGSPGFILDEGR